MERKRQGSQFDEASGMRVGVKGKQIVEENTTSTGTQREGTHESKIRKTYLATGVNVRMKEW